jgi:hypothetical protein
LACGEKTPPLTHENRARLFKNILESPVTFPLDIDPGMREYVDLALQKDPTKRAGFNQLKNCSLFAGLNVNDLLEKRMFTQEQAMDSSIAPVSGAAEKLPGLPFANNDIIPTEEDDDLGMTPLVASPTIVIEFSPV